MIINAKKANKHSATAIDLILRMGLSLRLHLVGFGQNQRQHITCQLVIDPVDIGVAIPGSDRMLHLQ